MEEMSRSHCRSVPASTMFGLDLGLEIAKMMFSYTSVISHGTFSIVWTRY